MDTGSLHYVVVLRRTLAALLLFGSLGTGAELLLLEHTEGTWQKVPLVVIAAGCVGLWLLVVRPSPAAVRGFRVLMVLFVVSGIAGVILHVQGNAEFERELQPDAGGVMLFWEALRGATPALAPGTMVLLGGLGLAYAYRGAAATRPERSGSKGVGDLGELRG
jgi:hypothetical protein